MKLDITFGWHLDGHSYPHNAALGKLAVGPIGFLHQLALRLGLPTSFPPRAVRVAKYLARLRALDTSNRFYSASFKTDPWGTASALIRLRDELCANGWKAAQKQDLSDRLNTLWEIEATLGNQPQCLTDLCQPILEEIQRRSQPLFGHLRLCDREELLPPVWRRMVRALHHSGVDISQIYQTPIANQEQQSDIGRLSQSLASGSLDCQLTGDGSLTILEADDEVQCADFVASWLSVADPIESEDMVIVRGSPTTFLDQVLQGIGLPALGDTSKSPLRGFLQLLPLAFETSWRPVNPAHIVSLLLLPASPIPKFVAGSFMQAIKNQPGIGGGAWQKAWEEAARKKRSAIDGSADDLNDSNDSNETQEAARAQLTQEVEDALLDWKQWLEPVTFKPADGIPKSDALAICQRVRHYALRLFNSRAHEVYAAAATYAETLAQTIEAVDEENVAKTQLERMMEAVYGEGYSADPAQASNWTAVDHPGQVCAPCHTVVWWGFIDEHGARPPSGNPWTRAEISLLQQQGVDLESPTQAVVREAEAWRRPLIAPCRRLILVRPRTVAGHVVAPHPFFHELNLRLKALPAEANAAIIVQAHQLYDNENTLVWGRNIERVAVPALPLPKARPVWQVTPNSLSASPESPSSLERLLGCPLSWLLNFKLGVRPGRLLSVPEGHQLYGDLAHAIFSNLFAAGKQPSSESAAQEADCLFDELCQKIAAPLLLPGNSLERQKFRQAIRLAAAHFCKLVTEARFHSIDCESEKGSQMEDMELAGRPDMVLSHNQVHDFVIDLKWTRRPTQRRKEISEGRAIQLAMYAELCTKETGRPTQAGYYMLADRQLYCTSPEPFPSYSHVQCEPLDQTAKRVLTAYRTHLQVINKGTIYATGVDPVLLPLDQDEYELSEAATHSSIAGVEFALEPPCKFCNYGRLCGKTTNQEPTSR